MLLLFGSCVRHSEMQTTGADFLQGIWKQDSIPQQAQMLNYALHEIKFTCDSFYVQFDMHAKVNRMSDSCYNGGQWQETAKGVYVVRGDSLIAEGIYTKPNGKFKASGCYNKGPYNARFMIVKKTKDSIVLENRYDQRPIVLRKTQDITCVPKKRWED